MTQIDLKMKEICCSQSIFLFVNNTWFDAHTETPDSQGRPLQYLTSLAAHIQCPSQLSTLSLFGLAMAIGHVNP